MQKRIYIKCFLSAVLIANAWSCKHPHAVTQSTPSNKKPGSTTASTLPEKTEPGHQKSETTTSTPAGKGSSVLRATYAERLKVKESDIKNEKLYKFIDDWYAVPYRYAGKDKNGIDCSGFAGILCSTVYNKKVSASSKSIYDETKRVKLNDLKEGDLVFFIINGKSVSHVGVYLQHNKFVHASTRRGVIISDLDEPYYKKYYHGAGRIE